ncbi:hypothetical protein [Marinicella sp. W31]|uniref:hypothetical protein n=1 Tax=Marinicella sp. W31 TaxID=3023713 RepID=UPI0037577BE1
MNQPIDKKEITLQKEAEILLLNKRNESLHNAYAFVYHVIEDNPEPDVPDFVLKSTYDVIEKHEMKSKRFQRLSKIGMAITVVASIIISIAVLSAVKISFSAFSHIQWPLILSALIAVIMGSYIMTKLDSGILRSERVADSG